MSSAPLRSRYHLVTFGCQMNEYDSGLVAGMLEGAGARPVEAPGEADLIVVNTCSVRAKADETVFRTISNYACLKKRNPLLNPKRKPKNPKKKPTKRKRFSLPRVTSC